MARYVSADQSLSRTFLNTSIVMHSYCAVEVFRLPVAVWREQTWPSAR